ncbi:GNAT family N-acetyltransferase [Corynebacterium amycolatum]|uniref:GNAT family N-acetyltransferase n=1 Tax=Corynebacterium amycolatum TaxID=43765 RepID=A0AB37GBH1_CORAY|nr:GNAT family N-acetyltransferase [Corynebacterium amycolatum]MCQ9125484.1 GNAT family N-acetyltransferase [Corynebacterium amycolatum]MCQ9127885.1 GNAT family N-acetyltransferase [Corynebacterium amycolatum]MCQ9142861.1 GNAT family N-acetyltransferase [Corynebacterium amycolatum]MCQ9168511.1 GNAT family N-acetyltransferase [Corynebacterium amycolatum]MCQ9175490.1 GNAT family N-acetyltransferase [Corynebacterium amycolatum]
MTLPRPATPDDVHEIVDLIKDLAAYEKEPDAVRLTPERLREQLFGDNPAVFCHVVDSTSGNLDDCDDNDTGVSSGGVVNSGGVGGGPRLDGIALWFLNYSTWEGTHGIYLEDLYVRPEARGTGKGKALLQNLARIAVERGYSRVEWCVLKWNQPSIDFYRSLGAFPMDEWDTFRLTGQPLADFGA